MKTQCRISMITYCSLLTVLDLYLKLPKRLALCLITLMFHRFPVIAIGVLKWVDETVSDKSYFKLNTDHTPLHLVLVDEVCTVLFLSCSDT